MLRGLVVLLLLANVVFFSWTRGWLSPWLFAAASPDMAQREPQRLLAQVRPELVRVDGAPDRAPSAATPPPCMQIGPVDAAGLNRAEDALEQAGVTALGWKRIVVDGGWVLRIDDSNPEHQARVRALAASQPALGLAPCR